jgi:hypothetical protein
MTWLTWRQFRAQAVAAAAALAAFAILLAATGPGLARRFAGSGITGCHGGPGGGGCSSAATGFLNRLAATTVYPAVYALGLVVLIIAPVIMGIFWGAPLIARELETRTFALAWTQGITRTRWLAVKLALTGLAAMAVAEALSLMYAWWAEPIGRAVSLGASTSIFTGGRFSALIFATRGITPLGYAAFAFALGAAAGALIRRALPAMAVTLVIFAAVQIAMPLWVRPHLIPPRHTTSTFASVQAVDIGTLAATVVPGHPGAWILSSAGVDAAGRPVDLGAASASCFSPASPGVKEGPSAPQLWQCLQRQHIQASVTYQPGSRYWPLQGIETAIFGALALALAGFFCFWRLGRRRT